MAEKPKAIYDESKIRRACFLGLAILMFAGLPGCATVERRLDISKGGVNLHIPDRAWDPEKADLEAGWCGETSIQMALAFYGQEIPQDVIHRAGKPKHSDLQEADITPALKSLGVKFSRFDMNDGNMGDFISWIQDHLRRGQPVICGCKIYPADVPDGDVDHLVLATGYNEKGLLLNTQLNLDGQVLVAHRQLDSRHAGYAFKNTGHHYWGWAVTGIRK